MKQVEFQDGTVVRIVRQPLPRAIKLQIPLAAGQEASPAPGNRQNFEGPWQSWYHPNPKS